MEDVRMSYSDLTRSKVKELTDRLEQGMQDLFTSDKYREYLKTMSRFHDYSLRNTMLIHMQMPSATLVAGFNSWRYDFGRSIKKGEHGIRILAPDTFKKTVKKDKVDPYTKAPMLDGDGNPVKEETEVDALRYKVVPVFDVSQTHGKPIPQLAEDITGDVQQYEAFLEALRRVSPLPITFTQITEDGQIYNDHIEIRDGMSEIQTVSAVIHEIAHAKLHNLEVKPEDETTEEVEAESVSFVVCQRYGIETSANSFGYIATWSQNKEQPQLKASMEAIRKMASTLISAIDEKFAEVLKERGIDLAANIPGQEQIAGMEQSENAPSAQQARQSADTTFAMYSNIVLGQCRKDEAYQNACKNADEQNARSECESAVHRTVISMLGEHLELYRCFTEVPGFKERLADFVFANTYTEQSREQPTPASVADAQDRQRQILTDEFIKSFKIITQRAMMDETYLKARGDSLNGNFNDEKTARAGCEDAIERIVTAMQTEDARLYECYTSVPGFKERLIDVVFRNTYTDLLKELKKIDRMFQPESERKNTLPHMNYRRFAKMFPQIVSGEYEELRLEADDYMPLFLRCRGNNQISMAHTYIKNGDSMRDPRMFFEIDPEQQTLNALSFEQDDTNLFQEVYNDEGQANTNLQRSLNSFLSQWLKNIEQQGYIPIRAIKLEHNEDITITFDSEGKPIIPQDNTPEQSDDKGFPFRIGDTVYLENEHAYIIADIYGDGENVMLTDLTTPALTRNMSMDEFVALYGMYDKRQREQVPEENPWNSILDGQEFMPGSSYTQKAAALIDMIEQGDSVFGNEEKSLIANYAAHVEDLGQILNLIIELAEARYELQNGYPDRAVSDRINVEIEEAIRPHLETEQAAPVSIEQLQHEMEQYASDFVDFMMEHNQLEGLRPFVLNTDEEKIDVVSDIKKGQAKDDKNMLSRISLKEQYREQAQALLQRLERLETIVQDNPDVMITTDAHTTAETEQGYEKASNVPAQPQAASNREKSQFAADYYRYMRKAYNLGNPPPTPDEITASAAEIVESMQKDYGVAVRAALVSAGKNAVFPDEAEKLLPRLDKLFPYTMQQKNYMRFAALFPEIINTEYHDVTLQANYRKIPYKVAWVDNSVVSIVGLDRDSSEPMYALYAKVDFADYTISPHYLEPEEARLDSESNLDIFLSEELRIMENGHTVTARNTFTEFERNPALFSTPVFHKPDMYSPIPDVINTVSESEVPAEPEFDGPFPDPAIGFSERDLYGYTAPDILPLTASRAFELFDQDHTIYMLKPDNTEAMVFEREEIAGHDGIFGIEREEWEAAVEFAEMKAAVENSEGTREALLIYGKDNTYGIYQLRSGTETRDYRWETLDSLESRGLSVDRANYELVYMGPLAIRDTQTNLHKIYKTFNDDNERPADYTGHSVSKSDVIVLQWRGHVRSFYVDGSDFKEIPAFLGHEVNRPQQDSYVSLLREHIDNHYNYGYLTNTEKDTLLANIDSMNAAMLKFAENYTDTGVPLDVETERIDALFGETLEQARASALPVQQESAGPSVADLEAQVNAGQSISLTDLANAVKREKNQSKTQAKSSILSQLETNKKLASQDTQKTAPKRDADMEV